VEATERPRLPSSPLALRTPATPWWAYAVAVGPAAALYALLYVQPWVPMSRLIRDPATLNGRFYDGFISNVGVLLWCATAAVCLFRGGELRSRRGDDGAAHFLLSAGAFTAILLLDDLFMAHEQILPDLFGVPEKSVLASYALLLGAYLLGHWRQIMQVDAVILLLALGFFALSNALDVAIPYHFHDTAAGLEVNHGVILEEAFKFLGISAWTVFHLRAAWQARSTSGRES
jgi:hypothetical protein